MGKETTAENVYTMPCKPGSVFVNLGNECLNDCRFCVTRFGKFFGYDLDVSSDYYDARNVQKGFDRVKNICDKPNEIVICGYGEPFLHYDRVLDVSGMSRKSFGNNVPIRADTTGLWWKGRRDLSFLDHIDSLSISLNAESSEKYDAICQPRIEGAYDTLLDFLGNLKSEKENRKLSCLPFPDVRLTIVNTSAKEFMPPRKETDPVEDCLIPNIRACQDRANYFGFPLVVKKLFRDVTECCWNPKEIEEQTLNGGYLEGCLNCNHKHI